MGIGHPGPIARLIDQLTRLPGIGPKTAQRLAYHLLEQPVADVRALATAISDGREQVVHCDVCRSLSDTNPCRICSDPRRDPTTICVVEEARDVVAVERSRGYRGRYHVLGGAISPLDGIGPDELHIAELLGRVAAGGIREVIIATNPDLEGEATAMYLARELGPRGVRVTRLARGLPAGGDLEYVDEITLSRALEGRRDMA